MKQRHPRHQQRHELQALQEKLQKWHQTQLPAQVEERVLAALQREPVGQIGVQESDPPTGAFDTTAPDISTVEATTPDTSAPDAMTSGSPRGLLPLRRIGAGVWLRHRRKLLSAGGAVAGMVAFVGIITVVRMGVADSSGAAIHSSASLASVQSKSAAGNGSAASAAGAASDGTGTVVPPVLHFGESLTGSHVTIVLAHYPPGVRVPADAVKQTVYVSLPLYPASQRTTKKAGQAALTQVGSPYLEAGKAEYIVPASANTVTTWMVAKMNQLGYQHSGSATTGNRNGTVATGLMFQYKANKGLTVDISFQSLATDKALVVYFPQFIQTPSRNPASLLPNDISKIKVTYHPDKVNAAVVHKVITDRTVIRNLVQTANQMSVDTRGLHGCLLDFGQGAKMDFITTLGQHIMVTVNPACDTVTINGTTLKGQTLWQAITKVFNS